MNFPPGITETERGLMAVAYLVMRHGPAYVPLLDRLEREVEDQRQRGAHRDRASKILQAFTREVRNVSAG